MATSFYAALNSASQAAFGGKPTANSEAANVTWTHAATGIVVLVILQAALLIAPFVGTLPEALLAVTDFAVVAVLMLAVPFAILGSAALLLNKREQLPAIFLFLALVLAIGQIAALILGAFGINSHTVLAGVLAGFVAKTAKNLLGVGWGGAILIGALVGVGTFAAPFLLLALPTGQAMLAAG